MRTQAGICTALCAFVAAAVGCASSQEADCAILVEYGDVIYEGRGVAVAPREGEPVGTGIALGCDDGNGASPDAEVQLVAIEGVAPGLALMECGATSAVLVRRRAQVPAGVEALQRAPARAALDEPIDLAGPWLGILGADGHTELDLKPPYDVELFVETSSAARYERAFLTVRVPASLGAPLTRADIASSLWEGGTVSMRVRCGDDGAYVAEHIAASPPR